MLEYKINSCSISDCAPSWKWETDPEGFDDYDIWAVFRGTGRLFVGEKEFSVEKGVCMLLPPHKQIRGMHDENDPLLVMNVHFSIISKDESMESFDAQQRFLDDTDLFEKLLERVISCTYGEKHEDAMVWFKAVMSEFMSLRQIETDEKRRKAHVECVREICTIVNTLDNNIPKLSEFAQKYGYSATYLGKLFHKIIGISFSKYLLDSRMDKAKRMLASTEIPISEIAFRLQYCDVCFFIKQFKGIAGVSPGEYRKLHSGYKM